MPDVLTHVLVGYSLGTLLRLSNDRLRPAHVTLVMLGALSPDLVKVRILLPSAAVDALLAVPFSWDPLHTLGGSVLVGGLGALLVGPDQRRTVLALLAVGAVSHHALDLLLLKASGYAYPVFWPLTQYHPPAGGLYLSSDRWPAVAAGGVAAVLWAVARTRARATDSTA